MSTLQTEEKRYFARRLPLLRMKIGSGLASLHPTGEYSYQQIVEFFGLHFTTIGKIVRAARAVNRVQQN